MLDSLAHKVCLRLVDLSYQQVKQVGAVNILLATGLPKPYEIILFCKFLGLLDENLAGVGTHHALVAGA